MKIGTLIAALVGGIVFFVLGFLYFGILLGEIMKDNTVHYPGLMREEPFIWAIFLFNLVYAWLISFILENWRGAVGLAEGATVGAIIMFAVGLAVDVDFYAFMNVYKNVTPVLLHLVGVTVMGAVTGAVIALVQQRFNPRTAETA